MIRGGVSHMIKRKVEGSENSGYLIERDPLHANKFVIAVRHDRPEAEALDVLRRYLGVKAKNHTFVRREAFSVHSGRPVVRFDAIGFPTGITAKSFE